MSLKKSLPLEERPREKLMKNSPSVLTNAELLSIILQTGNKKQSAIELSRKILEKNDLKKLSRSRISSLKKSLGVGDAKACQIAASFELGRRVAQHKNPKSPEIKNAKTIANILIPEMSYLKKEIVKIIYLNTKNKITKTEDIFIGSLNESIMHPREILKGALEEGAASIIIAHNHPSGDVSPSPEDIKVTKEVQKAGEIIGIPLLDHIIVGNKNYLSFRERGLLN